MKKKEKDPSQNQVMEGFNPRVYRSLSLLFTVLTVLNLAVIIYAFARTGYGLWHAEDALSYIAKIDSNFEDINQSVLKIELYPDDQQLIANNIDNIYTYHRNMVNNAEAFRKIDLSNIDKSLSEEFEATYKKAESYYATIQENLNAVKSKVASPDVLRDTNTERLREETSEALNKLFEKQDEATYKFFCRVGQSFLLVILFLLATMLTGLYAIARIKKHDLAFAEKLQNSKMKTANIRQKAVEIAYTNVVTGLKNRYALEEDLGERLKGEDISIALFNFNNFKSLNENFGRDFADEFVSVISKRITTTFGKQGEVYSTDIDELCIVFNKEIPKSRTAGFSSRMLDALSQPVQVQNTTVQLTVAGCLFHCSAGSYASAAKMFIPIDHGMSQAKAMSMEQGKSVLIPVS